MGQKLTYLTVAALKALLATCQDSDIIILASDGEGNVYAPLADVSVNERFLPEDGDRSSTGSVFLRELTEEDRAEGYTEEDVCSLEEGGLDCVTLYPME